MTCKNVRGLTMAEIKEQIGQLVAMLDGDDGQAQDKPVEQGRK